jgi:hypothetical protein
MRAERHSNTDLWRACSGPVRHDAIKPDADESKAHSRKELGDKTREPEFHQRLIDDLGGRVRAKHELTAKRLDLARDFGAQRSRICLGSHMQVARLTLSNERRIYEKARMFPHILEPRIADDTHDKALDGSRRTVPDDLSNRVASREPSDASHHVPHSFIDAIIRTVTP